MEMEDVSSETLLQSFKSMSPEDVSSELKEMLTDSQSSYFRRFRSATWVELKLLFGLAAPTVFVYLLNNVVSMSTLIFCGHLGNLELAAVSVGNTGIQIFGYGLIVIITI